MADGSLPPSDARPTVTVVGLGPAAADLTTPAATAALEAAPLVLLRTARHPAAEPWLARGARPLDVHYEQAERFADVYPAIVEQVVAAALEHGAVAYAVPGSPTVLEDSVARLRADERVAVHLVAGMSFLDLAWARLGIDPVAAGVRLLDAQGFARQAAGDPGPFLVAHLVSRQQASEVKLSLETFPQAPVTLLHHLGLSDEVVVEVPWAELDRTLEVDHLTSCFVPRLAVPAAAELVALDELVRDLRQRCPWDAEQTHRSLVRYLREEAYEVIEALESLGDDPAQAPPAAAEHLEEELGDLLFQVLFHSLLAAEEGLFNLADVARAVHDKLVGRHPHLFDDGVAGAGPATSRAQEASWEQLKRAEKGRRGLGEGIPLALPALARVAKLEGRARSAGLALESTVGGGALAGAEDEERLGELLLVLARLAADRRLEPEEALHRAMRRWEERIAEAERLALERGAPLLELAPEEAREVWTAARAG